MSDKAAKPEPQWQKCLYPGCENLVPRISPTDSRLCYEHEDADPTDNPEYEKFVDTNGFD